MYFFHFDIISQILEAMKEGKQEIRLSLDLNLSCSTFQLDEEKLILNEDQVVSIDMLEGIAKVENKVFFFENAQMKPLEIRGQGYHKLVPTKGAPTLEIDGVKMHRSKDIDPFEDAKLKTKLVVTPGDILLDTCGGLGYSGIFALKAGAKKVVSFEKSKAVVTLRNANPWLKKYADHRLELTHGDVVTLIESLDGKMFNSVVHDPPRFTSATGDLYGKKFYDELFRVMRPGAKLFHYTGSPGRVKTRDRFINNTIKRLENSRFQNLEFHDNLQGIYGRKN